MIFGIGTDLVENRRLVRWLEQPALLEKYFSSLEQDDVKKSDHPAASLAARFAAKEAFGKALGTGLRGLRLRDIQVVRDPHGRPFLDLAASAQRALPSENTRVHLSLTHEAEFSLAFVILEV